LTFLAATPKLLYPRAFDESRAISGKARERAFLWNKVTPHVLSQQADTVLLDLDPGPRYNAFFALLAASEGYYSVAWTLSKDLVCPSVFINPGFDKRIVVLDASLSRTFPDLEAVSVDKPLLLHLADCKELSKVSNPSRPLSIVAIHRIWYADTKGIFQELENKSFFRLDLH
jgi:hypothetical protein